MGLVRTAQAVLLLGFFVSVFSVLCVVVSVKRKQGVSR